MRLLGRRGHSLIEIRSRHDAVLARSGTILTELLSVDPFGAAICRGDIYLG
jgi:hypothetical protein